MSPLETLGFALGTSFASGLNLYATVAAAGLFQRLGIVTLPEPLTVLGIPWCSASPSRCSSSSSSRTRSRTWTAPGMRCTRSSARPRPRSSPTAPSRTEFPEEWKLAAALLAGSVALTSHGAKASTRAAANASPEPLSNWTLSLLEDGLAVFLAWMAAEHPLLTAVIVVVLVIIAVFVIWTLFGYLRRALARLKHGPGTSPAGP